MENIAYYITFLVFALPLAGLIWMQGVGTAADEADKSKLKSLRTNFLVVYCLQMLGDWLQGPYVYAVHEQYGYSHAANGRLFIAGFASSLLVGTAAGALADKLGRRAAGLTYVITYSASCLTKHSPNFTILLTGRIFAGVASSLLHSAFEAWLVAEHFKSGFSQASLSQTFAWAFFLGNGLMAILAGFIGHTLVEKLYLGQVAPFDAAIVFMLVGGGIMIATWGENFGDKSITNLQEQFSKAWEVIRTDKAVALLGAMQSMFEAAMYAFVFLWTPALSLNGESIKHGLVFTNLMTAAMAGSFIAGVLMRHRKPEQYMKAVYAIAATAMAVPMLAALLQTPGSNKSNKNLNSQTAGTITLFGIAQMLAFCVFELCVGVFWPSIMAMRATYVPEELRATIINVFRIPLNIFVCLVLGNVDLLPLAALFGLCVILLAATCICQLQLERLFQCKQYSSIATSSSSAKQLSGSAKGTDASGTAVSITRPGTAPANIADSKFEV